MFLSEFSDGGIRPGASHFARSLEPLRSARQAARPKGLVDHGTASRSRTQGPCYATASTTGRQSAVVPDPTGVHPLVHTREAWINYRVSLCAKPQARTAPR